MEGTPPMSSYEDETGVKLIIIIIIIVSHKTLATAVSGCRAANCYQYRGHTHIGYLCYDYAFIG